jgi:hypothetical protein
MELNTTFYFYCQQFFSLRSFVAAAAAAAAACYTPTFHTYYSVAVCCAQPYVYMFLRGGKNLYFIYVIFLSVLAVCKKK